MVDPIGPMTIRPDPDPTARTMEALRQSEAANANNLNMRAEVRQREHYTLQELLETKLNASDALYEEKVASIRRENAIYEAHRLELKSDSEKTLNTATIAAEKAVQAALAAAEKARDQQTIASQLATTKAEEASKEQMKQQGETFTTAISGLIVGLGDVKTAVSELRAERRGSAEQIVVQRDTAADMKPLTEAIAMLVQSQNQSKGRENQVVDSRASNNLVIAGVGLILLFISLGIGIVSLMQ